MKISELKKIEKLLLITKESLRQMEKSEANLNSNLKYWIRKGIIKRLKKGRYILTSRYEKEADKQLYMEYLANKLYEPSYLSCEYVMNKYGLLTEAVYGITSITTRKTKSFSNDIGFFNYYSIRPDLFSGYGIKKYGTADIWYASKQKAVFDYLYLRFLKKNPINDKVVNELRINWENLKRGEFDEVRKYVKASGNMKLAQLINLIANKYYD